jgi:uncharacterized protein involved in exopolysaccharide biosynthesis
MPPEQKILQSASERESDFLAIAGRYKWTISAASALVALATLSITLLVPDRYVSTAVIFSPDKTYQPPGLAEFIGVVNMPPGLKMSVAILKSRKASERLIGAFNLRQVYGEDDPDELLKLVNRNIAVRDQKDGTIKITVQDRDPVRAANMANALVQILDEILINGQHTSSLGRPSLDTPQKSHSPIVDAIVDLVQTSTNQNGQQLVHRLDDARPPLKPDGPNRILLTLMGALFGLLGALLLAFVREFGMRRPVIGADIN